MLGVFLDTETNGLNFFKHRILEIALQIVDLVDGKSKISYESLICLSFDQWKESNLQSLSVTGFTWKDLQRGKQLENVKEQIIKIFQENKIDRTHAVFICQNPSFDRAFFSQIISPDEQETMNWPYHWLDLASMYWAKTLQINRKSENPYPWESGFSKDHIASRYQISSEAKPHRAMNGVKHLIKCYKAVVGFPLSRPKNATFP